MAIEDDLTLSETIPQGSQDVDSYDGESVVFAANVTFSSTPADAALFEKGGSGRGGWVGMRDSATTPTFRVRGGTGTTTSSSTTAIAVLDITDFPQDDAEHVVVWEFRVFPGRVRLWIDGEFKGSGSTTANGALGGGSNEWEGGGGGMFGDGSGSNVSGEPSSSWVSVYGASSVNGGCRTYGFQEVDQQDYTPANTLNRVEGLTLTNTFSTTTTDFDDTWMNLAANCVFEIDMDLPPAFDAANEGLIFELGGSGTAAWVGIRDSGATLRIRHGSGAVDGATVNTTSSNVLFMDIPTSSLTESANVTLTWEAQIHNVGSARAYIDGVHVANTKDPNTTPTAFTQNWSGTDHGGLGAIPTATNVANGETRAVAANIVFHEMRVYENQTIINWETADTGITGTAAITNDSDTLSGVGEVDIDGDATLTDDDNTTTTAGEVDVIATAAITQAGDTTSTNVDVIVDGTSTTTSDNNTLSSTGTVDDPAITGTASITQDNNTLSSAGEVDIDGSSTINSGDDTIAGDAFGEVGIEVTSTTSQDDNTLSAVGDTIAGGTSTTTTDDNTTSTAGEVDIDGTASITASDDTTTTNGEVDINATSSTTVDDNTLSATGTDASTLPVVFEGSKLVLETGTNSTTYESNTFTTTGGSDHILIATIVMQSAGSTLTQMVTDPATVTFGGETMTFINGVEYGSDSGPEIAMYYLLDPPASGNVSITLSSASRSASITVSEYSSVSASDPIGNVQSTNTSTIVSITPESSTSYIVSGSAQRDGDSGPYSPLSGWTELADINTGSATINDQAAFVGDLENDGTSEIDAGGSSTSGNTINTPVSLAVELLPVPSSIAGTAAITQDNNTVASTGEVDVEGTSSTSQDPDTLSGVGEVIPFITGTASVTQDDNTTSTAGEVDVSATSSTTLDFQTLSGVASVEIEGTTSTTQETQILTGVSSTEVEANSTTTQDDQTITSSGLVLIQGGLSETQDNNTLSATGIEGGNGLEETQDDNTLSGVGLILNRDSNQIGYRNGSSLGPIIRSAGITGTKTHKGSAIRIINSASNIKIN